MKEPAETTIAPTNGNGAKSLAKPDVPAPAPAAADGLEELKRILARAKAAQQEYSTFTQEQVGDACVVGTGCDGVALCHR